jgi:hypothetical protein
MVNSIAAALVVFQAGASSPSPTTAFVGFHILPMDAARVLREHTVVVSNGIITAVGPAAQVNVPRDAVRIQGNGRFLTPALADLHTHSAQDREMQLFVTGGVTTILNLAWSPAAFVQTDRHQYARGERLGPVVYEARRFNWPYGRNPGVATRQEARDTIVCVQFPK